ncbi:MAG: DUF6600 domain-containing protein, partial [Verrucomicrobiales bacterium]
AQIQSDLATIEASLAAAAAAPPPPPAAAEEPPDWEQDPGLVADVEPVVHQDVGLLAAQIAALGDFVPDPVAYEEFSEPLESYGDWYETESYGPVWQPGSNYVDQSWAPYTNGSWGYSNYGWNWQSRDPFGWACDHYGRWVYISRYGWVWVPGRRWAPAWVSWRSCNTHIGWAPLPPCATWNRGVGIGSWVDARCHIGPGHYNFVPRSHFGKRDTRSSIVDRSKNARLVGRSKNITRLEHGKHGVKNHGPDYNEVRAGSSERISRRTIDVADESKMKREKVEQGRAARARREETPRTGNIPNVRRETGWETSGDQGETLRLRRQLVSEARGSLLEQSRPVGKARAGATLTAITKPIRSRGGSISFADLHGAKPISAEVIQVGVRPSPPEPTAGRAVVPDRPRELPDHFAAERVQREATLARQQTATMERNRLASARQSAELKAKLRIENQILGRSPRAAAAARGIQERLNGLANSSRSSAVTARSGANARGQVAGSGSALAANDRSRQIAASALSTLAGRSNQKQSSASDALRSNTRSQLDPRRSLGSTRSPASSRGAVTRVDTSSARRNGSVTRSSPTSNLSRQAKSTRPSVSTSRSVPQTRSFTSSRTSKQAQPRSRPQVQRSSPRVTRSSPQSSRSSPQVTRSSPQTSRSSTLSTRSSTQSRSFSKQSKQGSSSGRSSAAGRSRK